MVSSLILSLGLSGCSLNLVGEYDEEYLLEALDVYNGTNNYYDESNDGKDFSNFQKIKIYD